MPLIVNLRHLDEQSLKLKGNLPAGELDLDLRDELIRAEKPLDYDLEVQMLEQSLLLQGCLRLQLRCQCVRCLKSFDYPLKLAKWTLLLPLEGEEKAEVVNDCVDLTPYLREDILLEFPQHPLCVTDCRGLPITDSGKAKKTSGPGQNESKSSAWAELDKLKF
jgi:uncharacterized metal-binding protein YceD (DUF177 family)